MKDDINRILTKHLHTYCDPSINYHSVQGIIPAADELTALMCYREVRAIMTAKAVYPFHKYERQMFDYLKQYYPEQTILQAIEKVKNEQK